MNLDRRWKNVFFVGIGGIGMSALARWFKINGYAVAGYDKTETQLTSVLVEEGMSVIFSDSVNALPTDFLVDPNSTLVIYTPAIPKDHEQLNYFKNSGFTLKKRSEVVGMIAGSMKTIGIAGTHGKTTTSTMVAHLLKNAGINCAAFLGGISNNFHSNFILNEPAENLKDVWCVVEADEFDRSFLTLYPHLAVVTSTDADHLDIYGAHEELLSTFDAYIGQIEDGGRLFSRDGLILNEKESVVREAYGIESGVYRAENIRIKGDVFVFDFAYPNGKIEGIEMQVPGFHNVENAVAAASIALAVGISPEKIKDGLVTFKGVYRRFEYALRGEITFIDDYAHHPTEIRSFLKSVRTLYPDRKITAIFQPHLYSRTRDFAADFANSLEECDRLLLLDIYPARELPIEGVTSEILINQMNLSDKQVISKENLLELISTEGADVLVTIGAGDIDKLVVPLTQILQNSVFHNR